MDARPGHETEGMTKHEAQHFLASPKMVTGLRNLIDRPVLIRTATIRRSQRWDTCFCSDFSGSQGRARAERQWRPWHFGLEAHAGDFRNHGI